MYFHHENVRPFLTIITNSFFFFRNMSCLLVHTPCQKQSGHNTFQWDIRTKLYCQFLGHGVMFSNLIVRNGHMEYIKLKLKLYLYIEIKLRQEHGCCQTCFKMWCAIIKLPICRLKIFSVNTNLYYNITVSIGSGAFRCHEMIWILQSSDGFILTGEKHKLLFFILLIHAICGG